MAAGIDYESERTFSIDGRLNVDMIIEQPEGHARTCGATVNRGARGTVVRHGIGIETSGRREPHVFQNAYLLAFRTQSAVGYELVGNLDALFRAIFTVELMIVEELTVFRDARQQMIAGVEPCLEAPPTVRNYGQMILCIAIDRLTPDEGDLRSAPVSSPP